MNAQPQLRPLYSLYPGTAFRLPMGCETLGGVLLETFAEGDCKVQLGNKVSYFSTHTMVYAGEGPPVTPMATASKVTATPTPTPVAVPTCQKETPMSATATKSAAPKAVAASNGKPKGKPAAAKAAAAPRAASNGKGLSCRDAAAKALKGLKYGLTLPELMERMLVKGLWAPAPDAKTPINTLSSRILEEIAKAGKASRFVKVHVALDGGGRGEVRYYSSEFAADVGAKIGAPGKGKKAAAKAPRKPAEARSEAKAKAAKPAPTAKAPKAPKAKPVTLDMPAF